MKNNIYKLKNKIKDIYIKDKKIINISLAIGFIITIILSFQTKAYSETMQQRIAQEIIRFHVIPNSNLQKDQELKMKVKKEVLKELAPKLELTKNINETREILKTNLEFIKYTTLKVIEESGYNYDVEVNMLNTHFPQINYGNMTLPAGEYEALQIVIGSGIGKNWWCVMFPMLCFIEQAQGKVSTEMKEEMREVLSEEDYNMIFQDTDLSIKFRSVEWWRNRQKGEFHVF